MILSGPFHFQENQDATRKSRWIRDGNTDATKESSITREGFSYKDTLMGVSYVDTQLLGENQNDDFASEADEEEEHGEDDCHGAKP